MNRHRIRCAIYTRKSSEEGLDQSFNSLDAQREACGAFILSQKHEGWTVLSNRYDDGGFSGGSMDRPALKQLLADVQAGKLDTVVVYKVDRLTRSLIDFAKIIEIFDARSVSFVSVTQHFNTTNSMGRLTLNVLLSFAQFEREITGERIRDKIAASKKKGMWMGGVVPLGYDCVDHRLVINEVEAGTVRDIFRQYRRLGCVTRLKEFLDHKQIRSKVRTSGTGRKSGGTAYSRGALYHLLNNRVYTGEIVHGSQFYPGQHQAIVPRQLWDQVAARLRANNQGQRVGKSTSEPSLLSGRMFDSNGARFTPTGALKNKKRYRYYTSQTVIQGADAKPSITRFPAEELEKFVKSQIHLLLQEPKKSIAGVKDSSIRDAIAEGAKILAVEWPGLEISKQHVFVRKIVRRVVVGQSTVSIEIDQAQLFGSLLGENSEALAHMRAHNSGILRIVGAFQVLRRGAELRLTSSDNGSCFEGARVLSIVKAIARARDWYERIVAGEIRTIGQLTRESDLNERYVKRILQCAYLSPQIIEVLLAGKHRPNLTLKEILCGVPLNWREQETRIFGIPRTTSSC